MEVLGALASVLSTWLVTGVLLFEAFHRIVNPAPIDGKRAFPPPASQPALHSDNILMLHLDTHLRVGPSQCSYIVARPIALMRQGREASNGHEMSLDSF